MFNMATKDMFALYRTKKECVCNKRAKKKYKKMYDDWEDNEFNCGPMKFIWGLKSQSDCSNESPSFSTLNDIELYYNRSSGKYVLDIQGIIGERTKASVKEYLKSLFSAFEKYIRKNNDTVLSDKDATKPFGDYMSGDYISIDFIADDVLTLYYQFKILVKGYSVL